MKIGIPLQWPVVPADIGAEIGRVARLADESGLDSLWTADHLFPHAPTTLPREGPMLEAYSLLSYVAGITHQVRLGALVTCVSYRHPGVLLKQLTTLDVLSGGRVIFGVGAGWDAKEAHALGIPFPSLADRFEQLEEVLQIAGQMWSTNDDPFRGRHYQLGRTLNSPNTLQTPRPKILIGGSGERRTLPLVAQYADACNFFDYGQPLSSLHHKLDVLRAYCEAIGRDFAEIEKTTVTGFDLGVHRASGLRELIEHLVQLGELGIDHVILDNPRFEWTDDLDAVLSIVDEVHAIHTL